MRSNLLSKRVLRPRKYLQNFPFSPQKFSYSGRKRNQFTILGFLFSFLTALSVSMTLILSCRFPFGNWFSRGPAAHARNSMQTRVAIFIISCNFESFNLQFEHFFQSSPRTVHHKTIKVFSKGLFFRTISGNPGFPLFTTHLRRIRAAASICQSHAKRMHQ